MRSLLTGCSASLATSATGVWPVLFVPAQRKRLPLQPQKGVPNLLRAIAEHANKAEKETETG